ncbi:MAG: oligoribonuclease [Deltaproteobacteria bacterium]
MDHSLVWIDLEMTGLDPERHLILEIASIVTDGQLNVLAEGPDLVIHYDPSALSTMDEWSRAHHQSSGLLSRIEASSYSCGQAEAQTLDFLSTYCKNSATSGNRLKSCDTIAKRYSFDGDLSSHGSFMLGNVMNLPSRGESSW